MPQIDKIPTYCATPDQLEVGDILVFNVNPESHARGAAASAAATAVRQQAAMNESGGHNESVHAGFVVEVDEGDKKVKKVAHIRIGGFTLSNLDEFKTTTHVYRPTIHRKELQQELNQIVAEQEKVKETIKWKGFITFRSWVRRMLSSLGIKNTNPHGVPLSDTEAAKLPHQAIEPATICSKFVAEAYITACYRMTKNDQSASGHHDFRRELMNIGSFTPPKTLQAYLYRNANFDYAVMPAAREKVFDNLLAVIDKEIARLNKGDAKAKDKANALQKIKDGFQATGNEWENARDLLKAIIPTLKTNTGRNVRVPTSYKNVVAYANNQGLYLDYIEKDLRFDRTHMRETVEQEYKYNRPMAELYVKYRELGYSDEEARFECKPGGSPDSLAGSVGGGLHDWYKMHPGRNIAVGCTVVGAIVAFGVACDQTRKALARKTILRSEATESCTLLPRV